MKLTPQLTFDGRAQQALDFYTSVFGAKVEMLVRFGEFNNDEVGKNLSAEDMNRIMFAYFSFDNIHIAVMDNCPGTSEIQGNNTYLNLEVKSGEVEPLFAKLSDGGTIFCPPSKMSWTECFACFSDKFGINWNLFVEE